MRRVEQLDDYGCGLACVAMVTGKTYASIRRDHPDGVDGTHLRDLRKLLRRHRAGCGERMIPMRTRKPDDLPFDAIIKINPRRGGEPHYGSADLLSVYFATASKLAELAAFHNHIQRSGKKADRIAIS